MNHYQYCCGALVSLYPIDKNAAEQKRDEKTEHCIVE